MQPFLKTEYILTFISDSNQLLYRLNQLSRLDTHSTLISSYVAALYPSIPHKEGLLAITSFLTDKSMYSDRQIAIIIKALELAFSDNYVLWNGRIYKQTSGIAIGTPVAVVYANIFMHWIDEEISRLALYIGLKPF